MPLLIYNPDHDEALAANIDNYTPTKAAQQQIAYWHDRQLPWQKDGDQVWHYGDTINWNSVDEICPFGWDRALRQRLRRAGAPERLLPNDTTLNNIRRLSSRRTTHLLLPMLREDIDESFGESYWCTRETEIQQLLDTYQRIVVKSPWSCAGRGVRILTNDAPLPLGLLKQGEAEVEPFYPHCTDFALEWHYSEQKITLLGFNVFRTYRGRFCGNMPEAPLPITRELLLATADSIQHHLPTLLGNDYEGPLGIDMMSDTEGHIHPCVELNLRRTMAETRKI